MPVTSVRRRISLFRRFLRVVGPGLPPDLVREAGEGRRVLAVAVTVVALGAHRGGGVGTVPGGLRGGTGGPSRVIRVWWAGRTSRALGVRALLPQLLCDSYDLLEVPV